MSGGEPVIPGEGAEVEAPYTGPPPTRPPPAWQPAWVPAPPPPVLLPPPSALPPGMRWAPPPGTPPHDVPQPYLLAMRSRDWAWWRPALGLVLFAIVYLVLAAAAAIAALLGLVAAGTDPGVLPDLVTT